MAAKRFLTHHIHSHTHRHGAHAYCGAHISAHVEGDAQADHPSNISFVSLRRGQRHVHSCMIREIGIERNHQQAGSKASGAGHAASQTQQQSRWMTRVTDHCTGAHHSQVNLRGSEILAQQQLHGRGTPENSACPESLEQPATMKAPSDGVAKTVHQQQVRQGPGVLFPHQQQLMTRRPLPKRLLPITLTRRSVSTIISSSSIGTSLPIGMSIQLTDLESKLFDILKDFLLFYKLETNIRVAGGWVRDKLLGRQCDDIDIALDNMRGKTFCQKFYSYCRMIGLEPNGFTVLKSKPMQAKHLEVAKMEILGVTIDFVNLRPPDYTECSLSLQDIGTPEEDAYLRDLTINSLFFNVNTGMVEDPTGRGFSDLRAGIIATPSQAKSTFMDDPLRALRALRFVSALCFELHPDAKDAIDSDVKLALAAKISRERIGGEVERIFRCIQPLKALQILVETELFPIVFGLPTEINFVLPQGTERACLRALELTVEIVNYFGSSKLLEEHRKSLYMAAFLSPLRSYTYEHKEKRVPITTAIIKESLKLKSVDAAMVTTLHKTAGNYIAIEKLIKRMQAVDQCANDSSSSEIWTSHRGMTYELGKLLGEARGLWRAALLLGTVLEEFHKILSYGKRREELRRKANICTLMEEEIMKLGLDEVNGPFPL